MAPIRGVGQLRVRAASVAAVDRASRFLAAEVVDESLLLGGAHAGELTGQGPDKGGWELIEHAR